MIQAQSLISDFIRIFLSGLKGQHTLEVLARQMAPTCTWSHGWWGGSLRKWLKGWRFNSGWLLLRTCLVCQAQMGWPDSWNFIQRSVINISDGSDDPSGLEPADRNTRLQGWSRHQSTALTST